MVFSKESRLNKLKTQAKTKSKLLHIQDKIKQKYLRINLPPYTQTPKKSGFTNDLYTTHGVRSTKVNLEHTVHWQNCKWSLLVSWRLVERLKNIQYIAPNEVAIGMCGIGQYLQIKNKLTARSKMQLNSNARAHTNFSCSPSVIYNSI